MITDREYLKDRDIKYPLNKIQLRNMINLLAIINLVRTKYGKPMIVTSGYRDPETNKAAGGSPSSSHLTCEAIDLKDDGTIAKWIIDNNILVDYFLYMEDPAHTKGWVHLTTRPPLSGNRIFKP